MRLNKSKTKRGIAMIELIFALVIMGIVLMSAPMLIQQSIRSNNIALQQEAIAAAASQVAIVLSMHWDENNCSLTVGTSPMLDSNRSVTPNPFNFNSGNPDGLMGPTSGIRVSGRATRDGTNILTPSTTFGMDFNESNYTSFDDIDDFHGSDLGLTVFNNETTTSDIGDYVDTTLNMNTKINYAEDRPDGNLLDSSDISINISGGMSRINSTDIGTTSNIKFIHVNLTSTSGEETLDKNISLEAFSCNIGTYLPQGEDEKL